MSTLNGQELEIFRAGDYGAKGKYTPADLQQLAADYDPSHHEAPIVVGHPKTDAPAFGWVKKLRAAGDLLFATPGDVVPAFDAAVQAKQYKKRSVALLRGADGKLQLRHLGFLGAMPPEVLGLKDAAFSGASFEEIEFSATNQGEVDMADEQQQKKSIADGVTEFFANLSGKKPEPQPADLAALEQRLDAKFAAQIAAKDTQIAALQANFSAHQAAASGSATQARIDGLIAGLKANRRWLPAYDAMGVAAVFSALAASTVQEIEFSAGTQAAPKTIKADPVAAFAAILDGIGKIIPEGRVVTGEPGKLAQVPAGASGANPASVLFHQAVEARAKEKSIPYNDALSQLRQEGVSNESYGSASAGEV